MQTHCGARLLKEHYSTRDHLICYVQSMEQAQMSALLRRHYELLPAFCDQRVTHIQQGSYSQSHKSSTLSFNESLTADATGTLPNLRRRYHVRVGLTGACEETVAGRVHSWVIFSAQGFVSTVDLVILVQSKRLSKILISAG